METCSQCDKSVHAKGLCQPHYRQAQRQERGLKKPGPKPDPTKPNSRYRPKQPRELQEFCWRGHDRSHRNRHGQCLKCAAINQKKYNRASKYGLSPEAWQTKLDEQENRCAICQHEFGAGEYRPEMDHDHTCCGNETTCGQCLRKILCNNCNGLLGKAKDSITILQNAISYLQAYEDEQGTIDARS